MISSHQRTLDTILNIVAQSIKNEDDQLLFHAFLLSRTGLSATSFLSLSQTVGNNINAQKSERNAAHLNEIKRVLHEWDHIHPEDGFAWILPRTSVPEYYRVHLDMRNVQTGTRAFEGEVSIDLTIVQNTDRIMMHSANQEVLSVTAVNRDTMEEITIVGSRMTPSVNTILVFFDHTINAGTRLTIDIKYQASLITVPDGFYQTSYVMDGTTRYIAATQFEEVGARTAFPCYDEPEYKAVFEVWITHDASMTAYANTMETVTDK